ncbi:MAG: hypothetical protein R2873_34950 [Caldilineaceae bacterium]
MSDTSPTPVRIAMWSGPRNISTAMMRSWENRPDTVVVDEPLYAHYLQSTGSDHPASGEVIAAQDPDWRAVVAHLVDDPLPSGKSIYFQKHMTHHILDDMELDWVDSLTNCFLLRSPQEVINSYIKVRPNPPWPTSACFSSAASLITCALSAERSPGARLRDVLMDPARPRPAVPARRRTLRRADAQLARWSARHRWCLGALLVRCRVGVHRLAPYRAKDEPSLRIDGAARRSE